MDKGFKAIDKRLTKVEINQEKVQDDIKVLAEGVSANTEKIASLEKKIDILSSKVEKNDIEVKVIKGGKYKVN